MNFMNALETESKKGMTLTENGALAYETAGKALLDFLFATTALRKQSDDYIKREITKVYFEDPLIANKFMFWDRDVRGGNGERKIFRAFLIWLAENKSEVAKAVIGLVPEYGRWDDLWCLLDTELKDDVCTLVKKQIEEDIKHCESGKPISLLAKWLCSENASSPDTKRYAKIIRESLELTPRQYRKTLSRMRKYLDVVEVKTSANAWGEIKYEAVPSQANTKYNAAFMKHDQDRRISYLDSLKKGETKINASTLQPHEIVGKYVGHSGLWSRGSVNTYDETLEQLWKALPDETVGDTLVVSDSSGSMTSGYGSKVRPLDVANALAVYMADHNNGVWKDNYVTFSSNPRFIDLSNCKTLHDKLVVAYGESEIANTDIERTMMLILNTAIKNKCTQDEIPKNVLILSDCQFDSMVTFRGGNRNRKVLFENIADVFEEHGYKLPRIIFWNLSGNVNKTIPMQKNDLGVVLCSGFSIQLLHMVMSGKTDPYEAVLDTINTERYKAVEDAVKDLI